MNKIQNLKMISCKRCGGDMPELRLTQYGYNFCVNCSNVGARRGVPVQMGSGDHTWTETVIMEENDYKRFVELESINSKKSKSAKDELLELNSSERNLQGPFRIINEEEDGES